METSKRDYGLDLMRVIAICMIVFMHSPRPGSAPGYILSALSYVTASGLVLFFMISGALLLGNKLSTRDFLKRRFSKILWPTLFWTFFYLMVNIFNKGSLSSNVVESIVSIPFSAQANGVLWFMYTLAGLYLLTPIMSRWLKHASKHEVEFYLALWGITLLYPYLSRFLIVNETDTGILYYFAGYVGYFVLGYYLRNYYVFKLWHVIASIGIAVIVPVLLYSSGIEFDFYSMLWYLSFPVASMAFSLYVITSRLPIRRLSIIERCSKLSFGLYFVHIFFLTNVVWKVSYICNLPGVLQIITIATLTIILSYLVSWLISKLSFSKYIIGV